jgi:putative DNA methylase
VKKRVIEWNLPLMEISKASTHEKSVRHGHPSTLHLWWARRPLAASRATTFAALIDTPTSLKTQKEILALIEEIVPWNTVKSNLSPVIFQSQQRIKDQWDKQPPRILDPFSGGGSIPLEALRLGCEVYASDLNPVAVLISKATFEWPQCIANSKLASLVKKWAIRVYENVNRKIGQFYPDDPDGRIPIGYLWARTIQCPNPTCQAEIPLIKHFWLARTKKRLIAYKPIINLQSKTITFQIQENHAIDFDPSIGTITRAKAKCLICNQVTNAKKIQELAQEGKMFHKMTVVILRSPKKPIKRYRVANERDIQTFTQAVEYLNEKLSHFITNDALLPDEELPPMGTLGFGVRQYGMVKWQDLFNPRQQLALISFLEEIRILSKEIAQEHQEEIDSSPKPIKLSTIISTYLAIILGRLADKNANLVVYNAYGEKIEHVFGRTALPMAWDYAELNVFSGANGDWLHQLDWVKRFLENNSWSSGTTSSVYQASATKLPFPNKFFDAILTDPPYYDNVPYSDLSDFFYVWFKKAIGDLFVDLFATPLTPKSKEIVANKGRQTNPKAFFEKMIGLSFQEMYRVLKPEGIAIIVYAHKSSEGWETMLKALTQAGFIVTASWPIHTEMKTRLRAKTSAALASSIYLVCRKFPQQEIGYYREIRQEMELVIQKQLHRFWEDGIRGGDFFISAIGPAMEILSRYRRIERYSGEIVSFRDQLAEIRTISTNFLIMTVLRNQKTAIIDNLSQFYLAFRWTFQDTTIDFGEAQKLAQACGVEFNRLVKGGFVIKKGSKVKMLNAVNRSVINQNDPNLVNLMHLSLIAWKKGDNHQLEELLSSNPIINNSFWQFCQAVAECLPRKNEEKLLLEGLLVSKYCTRYLGH